MARKKDTRLKVNWKSALEEGDHFREFLRGAIQEVLEVEMEETLGSEKWERTSGRLGYRRTVTDNSTPLDDRLLSAEREGFRIVASADVHTGEVSTRKVKKITEELCGYDYSASARSDASADPLDSHHPQIDPLLTSPCTSVDEIVLNRGDNSYFFHVR